MTDEDPSSESDIQATKPPELVRVGGGLVLGAGVLALLVGVQTHTGFYVSGRLAPFLFGLMALGVATGALGLMIMRARAWAALAGAIVSGVLLVATGLWLFLSIANGLVSLFALAAPFAALVATVLAVLCVAPCQRASEARARLRERGLDLGT